MPDLHPKPKRPLYPRRPIPPLGGTEALSTPKQFSRFGSPLLGVAGEDPLKARSRIFFLLWLLITFAHVSGAVSCLLIITNVIPGMSIFHERFHVLTFLAVPIYLVVAYLLGLIASFFYINHILKWFVEERTPTDDDRHSVLIAPRVLAYLQLSLWIVGTIIFGVLYSLIAPWVGVRIVVTVLCGAFVMSAICYLVAEFALRPAAAVILQTGGPRTRQMTGISHRFLIAWLAGTGVPLLGLGIVAVFNMVKQEFTTFELARYVVILVIVILVYSAVLTFQLTNYLAPPIDLVRYGLDQVAQGNLDTEIVVFDGSEVGELQAGFNNMVQELRNQERVKQLFRQHVGSQVAEAALRNPVNSDQSRHVTQRDASMFFIDIMGSTKMSLEFDPPYVVDILNRFYTIVVEEVHATGGLVNKFAGDAVLAIYNVPDDHPDPAGAALFCARSVMNRLERELPEVTAAVGVSAGRVVAGDIGSEERFEYTVIGDPVNVASRLTELAKREPGRILASQRTVNLANEEEARCWMIDGATVLRGRSDATVLARPEIPVVTPVERD